MSDSLDFETLVLSRKEPRPPLPPSLLRCLRVPPLPAAGGPPVRTKEWSDQDGMHAVDFPLLLFGDGWRFGSFVMFYRFLLSPLLPRWLSGFFRFLLAAYLVHPDADRPRWDRERRTSGDGVLRDTGASTDESYVSWTWVPP